jgi:uncharacterized protein (TIGR02391 family)
MNLQGLIKSQLWFAISNTYEAGNYSHAILDAMHYLSEVLREKSGLDGDGQPLVGAALGGKSPILRVNKLQTETERNIQKGLAQMLRGMYQGIRNPRSHEQIEDTKTTADAIILFVNYLLGILDESQEPFTITGFLERVFDEHFVQSARYTELLVEEIPAGKRLDILIEIYRRKREGDGSNLKYVVKELLRQLAEDQIAHFLPIVSEELKVTQDTVDIRLTLQILPSELWPRLDEAARLRTENLLIKSIEEGRATSDGKIIKGAGALGTWARDFLKYFSLKSRAGQVVLKKLRQDEPSQQYIFHFLLGVLPDMYDTSYRKDACIVAIAEAVEAEFGDSLMRELRDYYWRFPEDWKNSLKGVIPALEEYEADIPF